MDKQTNNLQNTSTEAILEELFRDDQAAIEMGKATQERKMSLSDFFNSDFQNKGYNNGYQYRSIDFRDSRVSMIISDFQREIQKLVELFENELLKLDLHKIDISDAPDRLVERLKRKASAYNSKIDQLNAELKLCAEGKGMIAKAILEYKDGFHRGLYDVQEEDTFLSTVGINL